MLKKQIAVARDKERRPPATQVAVMAKLQQDKQIQEQEDSLELN